MFILTPITSPNKIENSGIEHPTIIDVKQAGSMKGHSC